MEPGFTAANHRLLLETEKVTIHANQYLSPRIQGHSWNKVYQDLSLLGQWTPQMDYRQQYLPQKPPQFQQQPFHNSNLLNSRMLVFRTLARLVHMHLELRATSSITKTSANMTSKDVPGASLSGKQLIQGCRFDTYCRKPGVYTLFVKSRSIGYACMNPWHDKELSISGDNI
ncbi:hypothetical protein B0O80DRAFT_500693 [Mortierella sp. GBAus27b]|nr:hypothetical protein B0O80DRAFT_500693 [Mortierella sp. GBAus27b]